MARNHVLPPTPTPLGGPEIARTKTLSFDRPTKKVDGSSKFPGTATRYPHPPKEPHTAQVAHHTISPAPKRTQSSGKSLLRTIGVKVEPTQTVTSEFIPPMEPRPTRPQRFGPSDLPTHSRDTRVIRPYSTPLDGPQWSPILDTRSNTPLTAEPTSASLPFERQTPTPLGYSGTAPLYTRRDLRTPTPLEIPQSSRPASPSHVRRSATFSGAISPQPSLPDSLSSDFSYKLENLELETARVLVHKQTKYGGRKRKYYGNQFAPKKNPFPLKSELREAYSPLPDNWHYKETPAARKLAYVQDEIHFTQREKEAQLRNENLVANIAVMQKMSNDMTMCSRCQRGRLWICGKDLRAGCATYIEMKSNVCDFQNGYWCVSRRFQPKIPIGDAHIVKGNALVYCSILGGRLIGVGHNRLDLYHAPLNINSPSSVFVFVQPQSDLLIAVNFAAEQSMMEAVKELKP